MVATTTPSPEAGHVFIDYSFYLAKDGTPQPKYLLILGRDDSGDLVARLLTSQRHGRPKNPRCNHGDPYPSYYLGVLGDQLGTDSWLDLRHLNDLDDREFSRRLREGYLAYVMALDHMTVCASLQCTAGADDTTYRQEKVLRDQRAELECP